MPYQSQIYFKKNRKMKPKKKPASAKAVADEALKVAKRVDRRCKPEYKRLSFQANNSAVSTSGLILSSLVMSGQGDSVSTRSGDEIRTSSIITNFVVTLHASATNTLIRCMLVHDNCPGGATATLAEILQDATVGDNIVSPINPAYRNRFYPIYDDVLTISAAAYETAHRKLYYPYRRKVIYTGTVGDVTDLDNANLLLIFIGSESTNTPTVTYFHQIRYTDS